MASKLPRVAFHLDKELSKEYLFKAAKKYDMGISKFINFLLLQHYRKYGKSE